MSAFNHYFKITLLTGGQEKPTSFKFSTEFPQRLLSSKSPSSRSTKRTKAKQSLIPLLTYTPLKRGRSPSPVTYTPLKRPRAPVTYTPLKGSQLPPPASYHSPADHSDHTTSPCQVTAASSSEYHNPRLPPLLIGRDHDQEPSIKRYQQVVMEKEAALCRISRLEMDLDEAKVEIARLRAFITEEGRRLLNGC